jgi:hypothetical protein
VRHRRRILSATGRRPTRRCRCSSLLRQEAIFPLQEPPDVQKRPYLRATRPSQELIITSPLGVVPGSLSCSYPSAQYDIPVTGHWDLEEQAMVRSWWLTLRLSVSIR